MSIKLPNLKNQQGLYDDKTVVPIPWGIPGGIDPRIMKINENTGKSSTDHLGSAVSPGNIDLNNRPIVHNPDGSISTVRSITIEQDGKAVLIPTVSEDGRIMTNDDAVNQYHQTGKHLGIFSNEDAANAYAQQLHEQQAGQYLPNEDQEQNSDSNLLDLFGASEILKAFGINDYFNGGL